MRELHHLSTVADLSETGPRCYMRVIPGRHIDVHVNRLPAAPVVVVGVG